MRHDGRQDKELRKIEMKTNVFKHPEGSVQISFGATTVICSASVEEKVPPFLRGQGTGWISAEYSMLPRATHKRNMRESTKGRVSGRTMEIQRLIGRSLRSVVDLDKLGERSIFIDCDVLQADGGTRTASITGAFIALKLAVDELLHKKIISENPIKEYVAAVSVGLLENRSCVVDLDYAEDSNALVDMNLVMTESGEFVEIQGTGEKTTFTGDELNTLLLYGTAGIEYLISQQKEVLITQGIFPQSANDKNTIVIATRNQGKAKEFESLFLAKGYQIKTLLDYPELPEIEEIGTTFEENARLKAETIAAILDQPVLADDSGLVVDALNGFPGIYSARFAGEPTNDAANNAKLLHELTGVPQEQRTAKYHCTLVLAAPDKESLVVEGEWQGAILTIPKGDGGFGYDSLFYIPTEQKSVAQMSDEQKNKYSHRGQAVEKLKIQWEKWLEN